jgi:sugar lactone lactonase YvrE
VDTSFARGVDETLVEFGEAQPRGRLFKYDQLNDKIELLLQGLYFPNGVTLTPNKDAVLVNEMTATRILK